MCAGNTRTILARGPASAPPLHPPGLWRVTASSLTAPADRIAGPSLAGDFALPAPIDKGACRRPFDPARRAWSVSCSTCTEPWRTVMAGPAPLRGRLRAPPRPPWSASCRRTTRREISLSRHPSTTPAHWTFSRRASAASKICRHTPLSSVRKRRCRYRACLGSSSPTPMMHPG